MGGNALTQFSRLPYPPHSHVSYGKEYFELDLNQIRSWFGLPTRVKNKMGIISVKIAALFFTGLVLLLSLEEAQGKKLWSLYFMRFKNLALLKIVILICSTGIRLRPCYPYQPVLRRTDGESGGFDGWRYGFSGGYDASGRAQPDPEQPEQPAIHNKPYTGPPLNKPSPVKPKPRPQSPFQTDHYVGCCSCGWSSCCGSMCHG